jgi:hypothetical protein
MIVRWHTRRAKQRRDMDNMDNADHAQDTNLQPLSPRSGQRAMRPVLVAAIVVLGLLVISGVGAFAFGRVGLPWRLGVPTATGPTYTTLNNTHTVGDRTINLSRGAFTTKQVIIGYTYAYPATSITSGDIAGICSLSLMSDHIDSFTYTGVNIDVVSQGVKNGVAHGSEELWFDVTQLESSRESRHLRLTLHRCEGPYESEAVAFDVTLPIQ